MIRDVLFCVRIVSRHRFLSGLAIGGLAVALGLACTLLTIVNAVIWPELGVRDPEHLAWVEPVSSRTDPAAERSAWTLTDYRSFEQGGLDDLTAIVYGSQAVWLNENANRIEQVAFVPDGFFQLVGGRPKIGRLLDGSDQQREPAGVVLSFGMWSRAFSEADSVLGRQIKVGSDLFAVVGVIDADFAGPASTLRPAIWLPMSALSKKAGGEAAVFPQILARTENEGAASRLRNRIGAFFPEQRVALRPILAPQRIRDGLSVATGLILLVSSIVIVAYLNLAGFTIVLLSQRQQELATRLSIGASIGRLTRQLATEGLAITTVGAAVGLWLAMLATPLLVRYLDLPIGLSARFDGRIYAFLTVTTLAISLLASLGPIRRLRKGWSAKAGEPSRLHQSLVAAQVALSVLFAATSLVLTRASHRAYEAELGQDLRKLYALSGGALSPNWTPPDADAYWNQALQRVRSMAGVEGAAMAQYVFGSSSEAATFGSSTGQRYKVSVNRTSPNYFAVAGIPLLRGRLYEQEPASNQEVVLVSAKVAAALWGIDNAVGQSLKAGSEPSAVVIGVVGDVVSTSLLELSGFQGALYYPLQPKSLPRAFMVIRTSQGEAARGAIQQGLPAFRADRPPRLTSLEQAVDDQIRLLQMPARLSQLAFVVVIVLMCCGLHNLSSLIVRQNLTNVAIRLAVGGKPWVVARQMVGAVVRPAMVGVVLGAIGSYAAIRALSGLVMGTGLLDPFGIGSLAGLLVVSMTAGVANSMWIATRVDPASLLKSV